MLFPAVANGGATLKSAVDSLFWLSQDNRTHFYPQVSLLEKEFCPYCNKNLSQLKDIHRSMGAIINQHLLACHKSTVCREKEQEIGFQNSGQPCQWRGCTSFGQIMDVHLLLEHNSQHLEELLVPRCQWLGCGQVY